MASFVVASPYLVVVVLEEGKEEYTSVKEGDLYWWSLFMKEKKDVWTPSVLLSVTYNNSNLEDTVIKAILWHCKEGNTGICLQGGTVVVEVMI